MGRSLRFFLILLLSAAVSASWTCGVNEQWQKQHSLPQDHRRRLDELPAVPRESSLGPLRLQVYYDSNLYLYDNLTDIVKKEVMPGVQQWFANIFKVYNVKGNLVLNQSYCYDFSIPTEHTTTGVSNADVIIYIRSQSESSNWFARAGACGFDGGNSRNSPIVGLLELNSFLFTPGLPTELFISILRHEITHVLAFSPDLYYLFRKADGSFYSNPVVNSTARGHQVTMLSTPNVVLRAQSAFACPSLRGVELENYGGDGTAGAHWEYRVLIDEYMVGAANFDSVYSDITFALFQDSGWYEVDYSYADSIRYGKNEGCDFLTMKCVKNGVAQFPDFCDTFSYEKCNIYNTRKSSCYLTSYGSDLPAPYQYFSDPTVGGRNPYADFCPYLIPFADGDCRGHGLHPTSYFETVFGEKVCENCMCFTGTYIMENWNYNFSHSGCHEVECTSEAAFVTVFSTKLQCPYAGGNVTNIPGFTGYITCPSYEALCGGRNLCPNNCFGFGKCVKGKCQCMENHFGRDCSQSCHETCKTCSGAEETDCLSCLSSTQVLVNGACSCSAGYFLNPRTIQCEVFNFTCDPSCATCTNSSANSCLTCVGESTLTSDFSCTCGYFEFLDIATGKCEFCYDSCFHCNGPTENDCTDCLLYSMALPAGSSKGRCSCVPGTYEVSPLECDYCRRDCVTCQDASTCLTCSEDGGSKLADGKCTCKTGFFSNYGVCEACSSDCMECTDSSPGSCLSCKAPTATIGTLSLCTCPDHFFLTPNGTQCIECHARCKSCYGTGADQCLMCRDHFSMTQAGRCECPSGLFLVAGWTCRNCNPMCGSCSNSSVCLTCKASDADYSTGVCQCPAGRYMSSDWSQCLPCDSTCITCAGAGPSMCSSCKAPAKLAGTAPTSCKCDGDYALTTTGDCVLYCSPNCLSCSGSSATCTSCDKSVAKLVASQCSCLSSAYKSASGECMPCDPSCRTCVGDGPTQCLSCVGSRNRLQGRSPNSCGRPSSPGFGGASGHLAVTDSLDEGPRRETTCVPTFAPALICGLTTFLGLLIAVVARRSKTATVSTSPTTSEPKCAGNFNEEVVNLAVGKEDCTQIAPPQTPPNPLSGRWLRSHLLFSLFTLHPDVKKPYSVLILTASLALEVCILGLCYDRIDTGTVSTWSDVLSSYGGMDIVYLIASLCVGLLVAVLFTIAFRRQEVHNGLLIAVAGLSVAATGGILYQAANLCFQEAGRWTLAIPVLALGDVLAGKSLSALCFAIRN